MTDVILDLKVANSFATRARGLLFSKPLAAGHGLLLPGVSAVHGLLMNRPLDLAFLGADGRVLTIATLPPGRLRWCRGAQAVVELEAGQLGSLGIEVGVRISAKVAASRPGSEPEHETGSGSGSGPGRGPGRGPGHCIGALRSIAGILVCLSAVIGIAPSEDGLVASLVASSARADQGGARPAPRLDPGSDSRSDSRSDPRSESRSTTTKLPAAWIKRFADRAEKLYQSGADEEAIAAFATWLDADPAAEAIVILRIGNIHQRSGRDWLAIDSYRRALDLAPVADPAAAEARRKALANLEGLLEVVSQRVAEVLDPASGATTLSPPGSRAAPGRVGPSAPSLPPRRDVSPARDLPAPRRPMPAVVPVANLPAGTELAPSSPSMTPSRPARGPGGPASAGAVPKVEYLGHR